MYALAAMGISLALLVGLLRVRVRIGRAMLAATGALALLLGVGPWQFGHSLAVEWQQRPLTQQTGYLFISLSALLTLVNVFGGMLQETGISARLVPGVLGLLRSRRAALAGIPLIMGMLPTPGGIMLSAPVVRELGDRIGVERGRQAAINFFFRHQWEPVWPLFPAVPLVQKILDLPAGTMLTHNLIIPLCGITLGVFMLLLRGIPPRSENRHPQAAPARAARDLTAALWPIALTIGLYAGWGVPPAVGIGVAILILLPMHRVPLRRWRALFAAGFELELVLLVLGALLFKAVLESAGAVPQVVDFLGATPLPGGVIVFFLPFLVAFLTGVTTATVAITFPFLRAYIGTGAEAQVGLEVLAFAGVLCGLLLTPVHLCLALSCEYFDASFGRIIRHLIGPVVGIVLAAAAASMLLR